MRASRKRPSASRVPQLVVVTGKGGVGKSVIAAALATVLARGRRVLLLEADPRESLHILFGTPPSSGEVVAAGERLAVLNASPRAVLDDVVRERLRVAALSRRVLASPIYEHFAEGAPGLKEMMLLGHAMRVAEGEVKPAADVVVLDAPASGHALALLAAPLLVSEVIATGPIGAMAARIARFVADPGRTAVVLATLAEEMPVIETLETIAALGERFGRPPAIVAVNAVPPELKGRNGRKGVEGINGRVGVGMELWRARRRGAEAALERLGRDWAGPTAVLPLLPHDFGPALVRDLATAIAPALRWES